jgi:uncharacterized sporulation protein YeaH/YhbH (DUF444 family)
MKEIVYIRKTNEGWVCLQSPTNKYPSGGYVVTSSTYRTKKELIEHYLCTRGGECIFKKI